MDSDEAAEVFDRICLRELGIPASVFLTRWDSGHYAGVDVDVVDGLPDVVAAIPLVRGAR